MECLPRFAYGAEAAELERRRDGRGGRAGADGAELRLTSDIDLTLGEGAARGTLRLRDGESGFCAVTWGEGGLGGPRSAPEAVERMDSTDRVLARLAARRQLPRPSLAHPPAALGAGPQGPHLRADRRDPRRPDHLAAGDPGRRAQLGLPLQLDPRLDLQPLGAAHARLRPGGARLHALHARHLPRGPAAADHVRDRWREEADREDPRPPRRLRRRAAGADRQRRLSTSARTTSGERCWTRSTCTKKRSATRAPRPTAN